MRIRDKPKRAKKIIRWGKGLVVFITTEAKELGWDDRILLSVSIDEKEGKKFLKLEKIARL